MGEKIIMALNEKKNPLYEDWMKTYGFYESYSKEGGTFLFANDGKAWTDDAGNTFSALSNQKTWEAGYDYAMKHLPKLAFDEKQIVRLYQFLNDMDNKREDYKIEDIFDWLEKHYLNIKADYEAATKAQEIGG